MVKRMICPGVGDGLRWSWRILLCLATLCCLTAPAAAREAHAGSFLAKPVRTQAQFLALVQKNQALQKRYGRHLKMDWHAVPAYLAQRLRSDTIRKAGAFTVYNVTEDGTIYPTKQVLRAGTPIFRLGDEQNFFTRMGDPGRPFFTPVVVRKLPPDTAAAKQQPIIVSMPVE